MSDRDQELLTLGIEKGRLLERLEFIERRIAELQDQGHLQTESSEVGSPHALHADRLPGLILQSLDRDPSKDYGARELAELLGRDYDLVRTTLARMVREDRGRPPLIRKASKGRYASLRSSSMIPTLAERVLGIFRRDPRRPRTATSVARDLGIDDIARVTTAFRELAGALKIIRRASKTPGLYVLAPERDDSEEGAD